MAAGTYLVYDLLRNEFVNRVPPKYSRREFMKKAAIATAAGFAGGVAGLVSAGVNYEFFDPYENEARKVAKDPVLQQELSGAFRCAWE